MTQQNLRELAKQGDPKLIASVINRTLQPKGINAQVARDNDCLQVMLESDQVPSQPALMDFIRKGMLNLGVESIRTVKVYGRQVGEDLPAWEDEIELMPAADPMFYADEGAMAKKPVDDGDREPENYDREEEYDPDDEAEEEEEELDEAPSQKKKIPKAAIIAGAVFVPLAAIAGLFFTGNLPFLNSSAPKPATPSPVTSSKAASPKPKPTTSPAAAAPNATKVTKPAPAATATPKAAVPVPAPTATPKAAAPIPAPTATPKAGAPAPAPTATPKAAAPAPKPDSWREAVNKAQNAANLAQTSISKGEWNEVASEWQKAVQLMKAVPPSSPNYEKAQQKAAEYQSNLATAQRRAAAAE